MVPIIDLNNAFYGKEIVNFAVDNNPSDIKRSNQIIVVLEFNRSWFGFLVDKVDKIHRFNCEDLKGVEKAMSLEFVNSTISLSNRTIFVLDFEYLVSKLFFSESSAQIKPTNLGYLNKDLMPTLKILLIDDSKVMREVVLNYLTSLGCANVEVATNGKEGFDNYKSGFDERSSTSKYDLIISDLEMPLMDGFSLCQKIKILKPNQKFILLSSLASKQLNVQCKEVGVDKLVSKKDIDQLHVVITDLFS
jgi:two-component system chemotaxis response regulator CheV